jgi:GTP cyclohydrolase I
MNKDDIQERDNEPRRIPSAIEKAEGYPSAPPSLPKALEDIPLIRKAPSLPEDYSRPERRAMARSPLHGAPYGHAPAPSLATPVAMLGQPISALLRARLNALGMPFAANDNIAQVLLPGDVEQIQAEVQVAMENLLRALVIDVDTDHNTRETAKRVAKMYVKEVFKGRYLPPPEVTSFPNAKKLDEIYTCGPITVRSACSHHLVPIVGKCWIGVIPGERVIGLSKFNRIVEWIASRPQIQEELSVQIADYIENEIQPLGLAVVIKASHLCMTWRGVREPMESTMTNSVMRGYFRDNDSAKAEFMQLIK